VQLEKTRLRLATDKKLQPFYLPLAQLMPRVRKRKICNFNPWGYQGLGSLTPKALGRPVVWAPQSPQTADVTRLHQFDEYRGLVTKAL
jgi:hypothetical protein